MRPGLLRQDLLFNHKPGRDALMSHQDPGHVTSHAEDLQEALDWTVPQDLLSDIEFRRVPLVSAALTSALHEPAVERQMPQARSRTVGKDTCGHRRPPVPPAVIQ